MPGAIGTGRPAWETPAYPKMTPMSHWPIAVALAFAVPASAAVVVAPAAPASLQIQFAAPVIEAERPSLMLPTAVPALPALPGFPSAGLPTPLPLPLASPAPLAAEAAKPALEASAADAKKLFDGGRAATPGKDWTLGVFEGDGGAPVHYKSREGSGRAPARVYAGGLALNESFEPLFARAEKPAGDELFVWTRGHAPSAWRATKNPIDADARDLARAIVVAAENSPRGKVELALHSFGTLVFQRMIQLHAEPAVAAALKALDGSRVFLLHATTHFEGSEKRAGREFEQMGQATRAIVDWLDAGDTAAAAWDAAARMNPFLIPAASAWAAQWNFQREQLISMASKGAADMMRADLKEPWDKAIDHLRKAFLKDLETDTRNPGWQEAMLRRSSDMFRLEFSPGDAAKIHDLNIRLELIHADGDKLLNWESAKALFERLGIEAPKNAPPSGTVLRDKSGRFRARIVTGDHYWPLKKRDELAGILKP